VVGPENGVVDLSSSCPGEVVAVPGVVDLSSSCPGVVVAVPGVVVAVPGVVDLSSSCPGVVVDCPEPGVVEITTGSQTCLQQSSSVLANL
jgi:hypothetical protein